MVYGTSNGPRNDIGKYLGPWGSRGGGTILRGALMIIYATITIFKNHFPYYIYVLLQFLGLWGCSYYDSCYLLEIRPDNGFSENGENVETSKPRNLEASKPRGLGTSKPRNLETSKPRNLETSASKPRNLETSKPRNLGLETSKPRNLETSTSKPRNLETSKPQNLGLETLKPRP